MTGVVTGQGVDGGVWGALWSRLAPTGPPQVAGREVLVVGVAVVVVVFVPVAWRLVRVGVTLVHELGHAFVGVACGRRFTGFVLRSDMSGHAVTVGRARGFGRVATTWAGYPMPGLVAALLAWVVGTGYAALAVAVALVLLVVALPRVRSGLTFVVVTLVGAGLAALWWWRVDRVQAQVLLGVAGVLLVGGWRHLGAVLAAGSGPGSDPGALRQLTGIPALVWNATFAMVLGGATWVLWRVLIG